MSPHHRHALLSLILLSAFAACRSSGSGSDPDAGIDDELPPNLEVCATELAPASEGGCDVTSGSGSAVVIYGDVLGESAVYGNGAVMYDGEKITCVGCDCSQTPGFDTATVISCPAASISPGLINPHDHITFTEGSPINVGSKRYDHRHEWRKELSTPPNPHGTGGDSDGTRWGEIRMLMSGVTAMVGSGKANNMVRNLDRLGAEDRALGFQEVDFQTFSLGDSNSSSTNRPNCDWNYADTEFEVSEMAAYLPHIAEGINEYAATEFRCQSTSFGNAEDFTESNATHLHSIGLSSTDYFNMARDGTRLLWSPRSNISLYGMTAQVQIFHRLGGTVALGTDWTYSGSANMVRELACADSYNRNYLDRYFTDRDIFEMATINAAISTASEALVGSLTVGKLADIAIYKGTQRYYRAVIGGDNKGVALVIMAGDPLYGDSNLMSGLGKSCDPLDVCGTAKSICATQEFGKSYTGIQGAVTGAYPAFFCGEPSSEPTCTPSRTGEFTGVASAEDNDGDGVHNDVDNCPDVFNPVRPIDNGSQPDLDGDGIGDACDETPLPADLDGDGVDNLSDNCPFDANPDQADADDDNKGDVCDFCPTVPNPMSVCPEVVVDGVPATIADVQDGTQPEGAKVILSDAVVTAVYARGFWMQDPTNTGTHAGVHVYTSSAPGRTIGDQVDVEGVIQEFHGETQIVSPVVTFKGTTTPIAPVVITVAEAATEPYQGMLVRVSDATTVVNPYSCASDDANCNDSNLWQVNGTLVVYDRAYAGADWAAQAGQLDITGVMSYRFNTRRIQPRNAGDLLP
jgi:large repetitive protein